MRNEQEGVIDRMRVEEAKALARFINTWDRQYRARMRHSAVESDHSAPPQMFLMLEARYRDPRRTPHDHRVPIAHPGEYLNLIHRRTQRDPEASELEARLTEWLLD